MHVPTEWRYFGLKEKLLIIAYSAAFCIATSTHILDLATCGMYQVGNIPPWINVFWFLLTFADPLALCAFFVSIPLGTFCMLAIIYADMAVNGFVSLSLGGPAALTDFFFVCQAGFLLLITLTFAPFLRAVRRCVIADAERVYLRPLRGADASILGRILMDGDSMRWYPRPYTEKETKAWIRRNRRRYRKDGFGLWAVILKETGRCIGDCGVTLQNIDGRLLPEIGYHISPEYRGRGLAPEAARAALSYCSKAFKLSEVYSYCQAGNAPSRRVMEKLGLEYLESYTEDGYEKVVYRGRVR